MSWSVPDFAEIDLSQKVAKGDYLALKESIATSSELVRHVKLDLIETDDTVLGFTVLEVA